MRANAPLVQELHIASTIPTPHSAWAAIQSWHTTSILHPPYHSTYYLFLYSFLFIIIVHNLFIFLFYYGMLFENCI